ncbi:phosphatase PAP2 family protein [Paenibacillus sp. N3/727]|uniref:phosphatase PAP2 family protein n=1 Tax=Paenibacillus sp. N3/727 TaxID=2925845 RepID=UPI001F53B8DD|nr:phosphatase PAP2 family protein [Paenibacillus sp. N3/727]UNK15872.1 phosphatase PAP2 family protein [Paenibacillus sp. N3/727]
MKGKMATYKPLLWILAIPVLNIFYGILNHGDSNVNSMMTDLDAQIPFVPAFIIPYLLWYPFMITMLFTFCIKNRPVYYRTLLALCLGLIISYITFYVYQTSIVRPEVTGHGLLNWLVQLVYRTDGPYNCFPSIHVLSSYLMLKGIADCRNWPLLSIVLVRITSWSIILSTLLVKQHVILDIVGGIILAEIMYYAARKWMKPLQAMRNQASM